MFGAYRTFLALLVVVMHIGGIPSLGVYAVFGFYCLSGYLMTFIMQENYGYTVSGVLRYGINRILRIYPVYWISIIFSFLLLVLLGHSYVTDYHDSMFMPSGLRQVFSNLAIFFPLRENPRLTPPAWALTVEIFFYILIALGISRKKSVTLVWLTLSILFHVIALLPQNNWGRYFSPMAASLPFSSGALIYHFRSDIVRFVDKISPKSNILAPLILVFLFFLNWSIGIITGRENDIFFYSNHLICVAMVAVLHVPSQSPPLNKRLDKFLGDLSYPIYLFHYQVGLVVMALCSVAGYNVQRPSIPLMLLTIPLVILVSWLVNVFIERPIESIRKKVKE